MDMVQYHLRDVTFYVVTTSYFYYPVCLVLVHNSIGDNKQTAQMAQS